MPKPNPRPFTLADLMVLIAAIAAGFPLARWIRTEPRKFPGFSYTSFGAGNWLDHIWTLEPSCFAALLTLTLIPLRWRGPRPSAARVIRQPGAVACLAAAGAMVAGLHADLAGESIRNISYSYAPGGSPLIRTNIWYWASVVRPIPLVVIGAWSALALGGRWSPERSWIDRLGRALGVFWVAAYPVRLLGTWLDYWLPYNR